jgi:hypothetical protein
MPPAAFVEKAVETANHMHLAALLHHYVVLDFHLIDAGVILEQQIPAGLAADEFASDRDEGTFFVDMVLIVMPPSSLIELGIFWIYHPLSQIISNKNGRREIVILDYLSPPVCRKKQKRATKHNRCGLSAVACFQLSVV